MNESAEGGPMFKRILAPVDFTEKASVGVDAACELAVSGRGEVILLHVIETIEHMKFEEIRGFYDKLEKHANAELHKLAERATQAGVSVHEEVVYGKRARNIIEYATNHRVDLIAMSSHRFEPARERTSLASISYEVALLAPCPVLLLK
jgi:nucleotide-binding universal stress UspA family protein